MIDLNNLNIAYRGFSHEPSRTRKYLERRLVVKFSDRPPNLSSTMMVAV